MLNASALCATARRSRQVVGFGAGSYPLVERAYGVRPVGVCGEAAGVVHVLVIAVAVPVDEPDARRAPGLQRGHERVVDAAVIDFGRVARMAEPCEARPPAARAGYAPFHLLDRVLVGCADRDQVREVVVSLLLGEDDDLPGLVVLLGGSLGKLAAQRLLAGLLAQPVARVAGLRAAAVTPAAPLGPPAGVALAVLRAAAVVALAVLPPLPLVASSPGYRQPERRGRQPQNAGGAYGRPGNGAECEMHVRIVLIEKGLAVEITD